jgi:hypothetical protein
MKRNSLFYPDLRKIGEGWRTRIGEPPVSLRNSESSCENLSMLEQTDGEGRQVWLCACGEGADWGGRLPAGVDDVSPAGARLVVGRPFEPGTALCVELPGPASVLAEVVRVTPGRAGQWAVGCVFAVPLDDEDLRALGRESAAAARREGPRRACDRPGSFYPVRVLEAREAACRLLDVSRSGMRLLAREAVRVGTLLSVEVRGAAAPLLACVVRVAPREHGHWLLGCRLAAPLGEEEARRLAGR